MGGQSDVLQFLYETFYETDLPVKATDAELCRAFQDLRAFVVLDDLDIPSAHVEKLLDTIPQAVFALGSHEAVGPDVERFPIAGLRIDAALVLLERRLGRELGESERQAAVAACRALDGHPLKIIQLASLVLAVGGDMRHTFADELSPETLVDRLVATLQPEHRKVLDALCAVGGASLGSRHLAALTGMDDLAPAVERLVESGLVRTNSPRYRAARDVARDQRSGWEDKIRNYLVVLAAEPRRSGEQFPVVEEIPAVRAVLQRACRAGAWHDSLRLARAVEEPVALSCRWGMWNYVLQVQLQGARSIGDRRGEGWALHQLGTQALCLGDLSAARFYLTEALQLRESQGDTLGERATRHNLAHLDGPPGTGGAAPDRPAPPTGPATKPSPSGDLRRSRRLVAVVLAFALVAVLVGGWLNRSNRGDAMVVAHPGDLVFGERVMGTKDIPRRVDVLNRGSSSVRVAGVDLAGRHTGDFLVFTDRCTGATLAPRETCFVDIQFSPSTTGDRDAEVRIRAGLVDATVPLRGSGMARDPRQYLTVDTDHLAFPPTPVGVTSAELRVAVTGSDVRMGDTVAPSGADAADFATRRGECASVPEGFTCSLVVTFAPTSTGDKVAGLSFGTFASSVTLTGTGLPSPDPVPSTSPTTNPITTNSTAPTSTAAGQADIRLTSIQTCGTDCTIVIQVFNDGRSSADVTIDSSVTNASDSTSSCATPCRLAPIKAGENVSVRFDVKRMPGSQATFTATAVSSVPDPNPANNRIVSQLPIAPVPTTTTPTIAP